MHDHVRVRPAGTCTPRASTTRAGPPNGLFIQLYQPAGEDIEIPEAGYSFEHLKNAQALGDMQTLRSHGLGVARIEIDGPEAVRRLI